MKRQLLVCTITSMMLFGGSQTVRAGEKVHELGKSGLTIEGAVAEDDPKVSVEVVKGKEIELPGKLFLVKLAGGKRYQVAMNSTDLDSVLVIKDAEGKQLAWDDDSGGGLNSLLTFETGKAGNYKIYALSLKGTGNFTLQVKLASPLKVYELGKDGLKIEGKIAGTDPRVKFVPTPKEGEAQLPGKLFQVKLAGGKKYQVNMNSTDLDSVLVVKDPAGKQLAWDDDSGGGLNSQLTFETDKEGTYKIYALTLKGFGNFTLEIKVDAPSARNEKGKVPAPAAVLHEIRVKEEAIKLIPVTIGQSKK